MQRSSALDQLVSACYAAWQLKQEARIRFCTPLAGGEALRFFAVTGCTRGRLLGRSLKTWNLWERLQAMQTKTQAKTGTVSNITF